MRISILARLWTLTLILTAAAQAGVLFDTSGALALTDPTQLGRLSRNGILQDWAGSEPYPGVINTTTTYHYETFSVNVGCANYIQIDFDSLSANTFVSAYQTSYSPASMATNWLGDAGSSGNYFGTDPIFFNVIATGNSFLTVVINNTAAGNVGIGDPFHLTVEGFGDANFTEVPEPAAMLISLSGLAILLGRRALKRS